MSEFMRLLALALVSIAPVASAQTQTRFSEKQLALGRELLTEIERQYKPVEDAAKTEHVTRVAQALAGFAALSAPLSVRLLETEHPLANALPGGFLVVSSGLLAEAGEAELAPVLAHQIAHIAVRHGTRQAGAATIFMGGSGGVCDRLRDESLLPAGFVKQSREFEREADTLAGEYLAKAVTWPAVRRFRQAPKTETRSAR